MSGPAGVGADEAERWALDPTFPEVPLELLSQEGWREVGSDRWWYSEDIIYLEARALVRAVERCATSNHGRDSRSLFLGDNLAMVLAFERCRARDYKLLVLIRRMCAWCLARGLRARFRWVPSELNNSDSASRKYELRCDDVVGLTEQICNAAALSRIVIAWRSLVSTNSSDSRELSRSAESGRADRGPADDGLLPLRRPSGADQLGGGGERDGEAGCEPGAGHARGGADRGPRCSPRRRAGGDHERQGPGSRFGVRERRVALDASPDGGLVARGPATSQHWSAASSHA